MSNPNIKNRFVGSELLPAAGINQTFLAIADTFDTTIGRGLDASDFLDGGIRDINIAIKGLPTEKIADSAIDPDTHLGIESISSDKLLQTPGTGVIRDYHLNTTGAAADRVKMMRFPNYAHIDQYKLVSMIGYKDAYVGATTGEVSGSIVFDDDSLNGAVEFNASGTITIRAGLMNLGSNTWELWSWSINPPKIANISTTGFDYYYSFVNWLPQGSAPKMRLCWVATGRIDQ